ncbi:dethiobiotin synthase [uncultured Maricaulis sp.]|uniref:dethiobiotin synthase n=1 Tax=uncultured Maricaulis sp. TaxID=174710 RepID=UPI0030DD2964|tara:strand:+ start:99422 stop:100072 length:651 start_codon:yes stop_codon:yes gene_type:complete
MRRPFFITGTGTDIGKTHVLCALLGALREAGRTARVLKPVASGFDPDAVSVTDTIRLLRANGQTLSAETVQAMTPWRFKAAISPDMAARLENRELRLASVVKWCLDHLDPADPTLIEGAGGVMSPIAEDGLNLDLIRELDARPILIAGNYLGTISHTLTALRALDGRCTVIVNEMAPGPVSAAETAQAIARYAPRAGVRVFNNTDPSALLDILDRD